MLDNSLWSGNYTDCRDNFVNDARTSGAGFESIPSLVKGPSGEPLSMDVAAFVSDSDTHRVVLTSGLHGAEGLPGNAIQRCVLRQIASDGLPDGVGVVLIHAINPWGFAHRRRVDERNVDVNRNFINMGHVPDDLKNNGNDRYALLDPIINPPVAPGLADDARYWWKAGKLIVRHRGIKPLAGPIAEGQYHFPKGLFFGGQERSDSVRRLEDSMRCYTQGVPRITVLDVHSGLGPAGRVTLIGNTNEVHGDGRIKQLQQRYDMPVVLDRSPDNAYNARGTFSGWCEREFSERSFTFLCVEIGTVSPMKLFNALRKENQAHHWAAPDSQGFLATKRALVEVFAPRSRRWRESVLQQGMSVIKHSVQNGSVS